MTLVDNKCIIKEDIVNRIDKTNFKIISLVNLLKAPKSNKSPII